MSATHPDETTLLRSIQGDLPDRSQAALRKHLARCRPCRGQRNGTKRLHERLASAGDALAFHVGDPFAVRPAPPEAEKPREVALNAMAAALELLGQEKAALKTAIEEDASKAGRELRLGDAGARLAAAHLLEEAAAGDPSEDPMAFAKAVANRFEGAAPEVADEVNAVVSRAQLAAVARLVTGNWRLFSGRPKEAARGFAAAWTALAEFDSPEHLVASVEVGESLRRSYEGRPGESRLLAERALATFERYGLTRGVLRARHARAVALYTASAFRDAYREFRAVIGSKDATQLDRARAVSGAAFCLAARGRFHDAAKEYSLVRRRLKGEGAQMEQCLLQGEMKAALGTAGRWHRRRDGLAAFALPEAGGAFHAREIAAEIVKVAGEQGIELVESRLAAIEADPRRGYALLYAAQLAMPKVSSDPAMYVVLAKALASASRSLPFLRDKGPAQPVCREQVMGEALLLESGALNFQGLPKEARALARSARESFVQAGEDSFALALADYYEGSAASFEMDERDAWSLLRSTRAESQLFGQEKWAGRAEAALGTLLLNRGKNATAVRFLDDALAKLHPEQDGSPFAQILINRGYALVQLGRLDAAKATYAKALLMARRLGMSVNLLMIRTGLASIDLALGKLGRALLMFERIGTDARSLGLPMDVLCSELRIAECLGRMGREQEMLDRIERVRELPGAESLKHDQVLRKVLESAEQHTVNHELLSLAARFVEARARGIQATYRPFKLVKGGG